MRWANGPPPPTQVEMSSPQGVALSTHLPPIARQSSAAQLDQSKGDKQVDIRLDLQYMESAVHSDIDKILSELNVLINNNAITKPQAEFELDNLHLAYRETSGATRLKLRGLTCR